MAKTIKDINDATQLKNLNISFLSLVHKGANGKKIIWKSDVAAAEGAEEHIIALRDIRKSDDKQIVYGVVYAPDQVDSQGEFAKAEDIEAAAYGFMKSRNVLNVDANHDFDPKAAYVAESWLIKGTDSLFDKEPEGTWLVGIKVEDADLWASVKKGELEGISMAGSAVKIKKSSEEGSGIVAELKEIIAGLLKGAKEKEVDPAEKAKKEDEVKKIDGINLTNEEAETLAKALGSVNDLVEANKKLTERVETLEKSTGGKQSSAVDGGSNKAEVDYSAIV